ncbi:NAD(P)/FAD-dependent oxidoreductase [Alteribacillus iranensis]|uniref:Ferredoxin--NADP reductase n=1 Tax=Alteribacillus iranensis TaxID=930128 RepID=A0A1I2ERK4_9BACI|nr:NAD(P)/FAD-dependent oxidoreductase [Alteribacillus iranensis]SFE94850.1 thioredoxin reductase (NADPH) [Alteribacillus iranensis]
MVQEQDIYDITILGGGPAGLFTAFYSGMRQAKVKIIESMPQLGGQLSALYPEKYIYDVAGFPKIRAQELVDNLIEQMNMFETEVVLNQSVNDVSKTDENIFELQTDQETHYSKTIIITAGVGAFQPRKLKIEGCEAYEESNLHYFVNDLQQFKGQKVMILGGGDSAVDWANMLDPIADVTLVHRRDKFRAHEHSVEQLEKSNVRILTPFQVKDLAGNGNRIEQVILEEVKGDKTESISVDSLICNYGFVSSLGPIKNWGLEFEKNMIKVNSKMETNIEGIYAAGDVTTYDGKVKLIATGFGEAPTAVNNAKAYLDPKARLQPGHSSHMF